MSFRAAMDSHEQTDKLCSFIEFLLIVPTPTLVGMEELYTQLVFFCSFNFGRSIYSYRIVSGIIKKPVQRRIRNQKDFFDFCFLQGVIQV